MPRCGMARVLARRLFQPLTHPPSCNSQLWPRFVALCPFALWLRMKSNAVDLVLPIHGLQVCSVHPRIRPQTRTDVVLLSSHWPIPMPCVPNCVLRRASLVSSVLVCSGMFLPKEMEWHGRECHAMQCQSNCAQNTHKKKAACVDLRVGCAVSWLLANCPIRASPSSPYASRAPPKHSRPSNKKSADAPPDHQPAAALSQFNSPVASCLMVNCETYRPCYLPVTRPTAEVV